MMMRGLVSMVLALAVLSPAAALAQAAPEPVIGGADTAAAPQQTADAWASRCVAETRTAPLECSLIQRAVTQQGQLVGSVTLQLPPAGPQRIVVSVPLGFYLGAGVTYDVDGANPQPLDMQACDRSACYGEAALTPELLGAMQGGEKFNITFQNMQKQPVKLPMSLIGFTAAYDKAK